MPARSGGTLEMNRRSLAGIALERTIVMLPSFRPRLARAEDDL
jgi:hypothetical protein